jgi:hypothetical protein
LSREGFLVLSGIEVKGLSLNKNFMTTSLMLAVWILSPTVISGANYLEPQKTIIIAVTPELSLEEFERIERRNREDIQRNESTMPLDVKAQRVGVNSVLITWKPPRVPWVNGQPVIEYEVLRREEENDFAGVLRVKTTNLSFLDNTAIRGKTYIYKVGSNTKDYRGGMASAAPLQIP